MTGFQEIARFAYTNTVKLDPENMLDVLACAIKLEVEKVQDLAIELVESNINQKTVFKILQVARKFNLKRMEFKCYFFINGNPGVWKKSEDFLSLDLDALSDVVKICKLSEHTKSAVLGWAKKSCTEKKIEASMENMQLELGDLFDALKLSEAPKEPEKQEKSPPGKFYPPKSKNRGSETSDTKALMICGELRSKYYKEAVLNITTCQQDVIIKEIHFAFDLAQFEQEFFISITETYSRRKIFQRRFLLNRGLHKYDCFLIESGFKLFKGFREFSIKIEFPEPKLRFSLEDLFGKNSDTEQLKLVQQNRAADEARIISKIIYT